VQEIEREERLESEERHDRERERARRWVGLTEIVGLVEGNRGLGSAWRLSVEVDRVRRRRRR